MFYCHLFIRGMEDATPCRHYNYCWQKAKYLLLHYILILDTTTYCLIIQITPISNLPSWMWVYYFNLIYEINLFFKFLANQHTKWEIPIRCTIQEGKFDSNSLNNDVHSTHTYACKYLADNKWWRHISPCAKGYNI